MKIEWKSCFKVGVSIFLLYLCIHYWKLVSTFFSGTLGALIPLVIGGAVAYIVNIPMGAYEKCYFPKTNKKWLIKSRRPVCLVAAYLSIVAIISVVIMLVVPQLISCVSLLIDEVPGIMKGFVKWTENIDYIPKDWVNSIKKIDWESWIGNMAGILSSGVGNVMGTVINTVSVVFSGVFSGFIGLVLSVYILAEKEKILMLFEKLKKRFLPEKIYKKIDYVSSVINRSFRHYIIGQCTEAVILGVLCMLGMLVLGLPYESMIGALIAFCALIPVVGAFIGAGIGAFMILTVDPIKAVIFLIFIIVLQQLEGNIIYPKVVGSKLGLPAILVLAAVSVGGGIMGVFGMLLAVPLTSALWHILKDKLNEEHKIKDKQS
ncbi:MAG: AI-2E family transporter [Ruminococcaceae bacterium]|nr:AI-2E family transporter [Oscillospiraceae bacterium]